MITRVILISISFYLFWCFWLFPSTSLADGQNCYGFDNYCGGTYYTPDANRCYPTVTNLTATMIAKEPVASQFRCTFRVSVSGEGFQVGYNRHFSVNVRHRVDDYAPKNGGGCNTNNNLARDVCVECSEDCIDIEIIASAGMQVKFWAEAIQWHGMYSMPECECESDTIRINVNDGVGASDTLFPPPNDRELGQIACEAQAGDPINITNGNLFLDRTDARIGGDLGLPLAFQRFYNSYTDDTSSTLRSNWRHTYDYYLDLDTASGDFMLYEADGRVLTIERFDLKTYNDTVTSYVFPYGIHYGFSIDTSEGVYTIQRDDDVFLVFDSLGPIDYVDDHNGNRLTMHYTGSTLDSVTNASDRSLHFGYASGRLSQVKNSTGDTLAAYEYYVGTNLLKKVTYADDSWEEYTYGDSSWNDNQLVQAANSDGVSHNYEYDTLSLATQYYLAGGFERVTLDYDYEPTSGCPPGSTKVVVELTDTTTYYATFSPDAQFRHIRSRVDPACGGCPTEFEYSGGGQKAVVSYPNGVENEYVYDQRGNILNAQLGANTSLVQEQLFEYSLDYHVPTRRAQVSTANSSDSVETYLRYDDNGNLDTLIETGWRDASTSFADTTAFAYNADGQLTWINGSRAGNADSTKFVYYANGDLHYIIQANGDTTGYGQRNTMGQPTWICSPSGDTTRFAYDLKGMMTGLTTLAGTADSLVTAATYTFSGELAQITYPQGNSLRISYDSAGYVDSVINHLGDYIVYAYDSLGHLTEEAVYQADTTRRKDAAYRYARNGLLEASFDAAGDSTRFFYNAVGKLDTIINGLGDYTIYRYDSLSRLTEIVQFDGADTVKTSLTYDKHSNLSTVVDPSGFEYVFRYDDKGRKVFDSSGVTGSTTFGYDAADNLEWTVNALGDSAVFAYDELNRVTSIRYPDSQNVTYTYDGTEFSYGEGKLFKESTPACTTKFRYDQLSRLYREIRAFPGEATTYTTEYGYDDNGNLASLTYPSGTEITYVYDSADQISVVLMTRAGSTDTLLKSATYAPFGPMESWTLGNGLQMTSYWNDDYLRDSLLTGLDSLYAFAYDYDAVGGLLQIRDLLDSAGTRSYAYDEMGRLIQARSLTIPDTSITYQYLANGNRDTVISIDTLGAADTMTYTYSQNYLTQVGGGVASSYSYDSLGNVVQVVSGSDTTLFTYNDAGRLVEIDTGLTATYAYDATHRRVRKTLPSDTLKYINAVSGQVLAVYNEDGSWRFDIVYIHGIPLAKVIGGTPVETQYFINDHLGTPMALVDDQKTIRWSADWYPFGTLYNEQVSAQNDIRFPGQWRDAETDAYYNWHRYYATTTGRYLQADPIGLKGGVNVYLYAMSNPLSYFDAEGRSFASDLGHGTAQFLIGLGDAASFGFTSWIRSNDWYGGDCYTDRYSYGYVSGELTGDVVMVLLTWGTSEFKLATELFKSSVVRNQIFRWGISRYKLVKGTGAWATGIRRLHFHLAPAFKKYHLPWQWYPWLRESWTIVKRSFF